MKSCVSPYNDRGQGRGWPEEVILCDVTMRDGEQTPGVGFSLEEKIELARRLDEAGIPQLQVGLPGRSKAARIEAEKICRVRLGRELMAGAYEGGGTTSWRRSTAGRKSSILFPMSPTSGPWIHPLNRDDPAGLRGRRLHEGERGQDYQHQPARRDRTEENSFPDGERFAQMGISGSAWQHRQDRGKASAPSFRWVAPSNR
jgi:hypothetical protein